MTIGSIPNAWAELEARINAGHRDNLKEIAIRAARARGEACAGQLAARYDLRSLTAIERRTPTWTGRGPDGDVRTSKVLTRWIGGSRPSDTLVRRLDAEGVRYQVARIRDRRLWRLLDRNCPMDLAVDTLLAASITHRRLVHPRADARRMSSDDLDVRQIVRLRRRPTLQALEILAALCVAGRAWRNADLRAVAALTAFEVLAFNLAWRPAFRRSSKHLREACSHAFWTDLDLAGVALYTSDDDLEAAIARMMLSKRLPTPSPVEVYGALEQRIRSARRAHVRLQPVAEAVHSPEEYWRFQASAQMYVAGFGLPVAEWLRENTNYSGIEFVGYYPWLR